MCDWNEDGLRDLLGGDREGYVTLFMETGTGLHNSGHLQRDTNASQVDIDVGANCHVFVNDWNEDGKKDLIFGQEDPVNSGTIRVFLNIGTNAAPRFGSFALVLAGGAPINLFRCSPVVYDLDGDNLKDLIVGIYTGLVMFYKNVGTNAAPRFNLPAETLKTVSGTPITVGDCARIAFADWTGDGDMDLVISGYQGTVLLCENATVAIDDDARCMMHDTRLQIQPNPCRGKAVIRWTWDEGRDRTEHSGSQRQQARLRIYDVSGRVVKSLPITNHQLPITIHCNVCDQKGAALPAGVYCVRLEVGGSVLTHKVVVVE